MKKRLFFIALLSSLCLMAASCTPIASDDQLTKLTNELKALRESLSTTQQELASTKQALQQLQTTTANQSTVSKAASTAGTITCVGVPVIYHFTATPGSLVSGQSVSLQWNIGDADTVYIDHGIGNVAATGSRAIYPTSTVTYTLTATNRCGIVTGTAVITVQQYYQNTYRYYPNNYGYPYHYQPWNYPSRPPVPPGPLPPFPPSDNRTPPGPFPPFPSH